MIYAEYYFTVTLMDCPPIFAITKELAAEEIACDATPSMAFVLPICLPAA